MANESVVVGQLTSSTSTKTTTWADWCDYCWLTVNRLLLLFSSPRGPFFILFKLTDSTASWATAAAKKETLLLRRLHNSLQSLLPSFYFCHQVRKSLLHIYRNQIALPLYRNNDLLKANKCWYTILLAKDWHYVEKFSSSQSLFTTFCLSSIKRHDFGKKANDYCTVVENHLKGSFYINRGFNFEKLDFLTIFKHCGVLPNHSTKKSTLNLKPPTDISTDWIYLMETYMNWRIYPFLASFATACIKGQKDAVFLPLIHFCRQKRRRGEEIGGEQKPALCRLED